MREVPPHHRDRTAAHLRPRRAVRHGCRSHSSDLLGRVPAADGVHRRLARRARRRSRSQGDVRRIRLFLDGVELDPLDPRIARRRPRSTTCRSTRSRKLRIERGADEVRVYARSWRVDRTDAVHARRRLHGRPEHQPVSRLLRSALRRTARRSRSRPSSTTRSPTARCRRPDALNLMLRVGTTHGPWSGDLFAERSESQSRRPGRASATASSSTRHGARLRDARTTAYARIGNGDPERGRWFQMLASVEHVHAARRAQSSKLPRHAGGHDDRGPRLDRRSRTSTCSPAALTAARSRRQRRGAAPRRSGVRDAVTLRTRVIRSGLALARRCSPRRERALSEPAWRRRCASRRSSRVALLGTVSHDAGAGRFDRLLGDTVRVRRRSSANGAYPAGHGLLRSSASTARGRRLRARRAHELARRGGTPRSTICGSAAA